MGKLVTLEEALKRIEELEKENAKLREELEYYRNRKLSGRKKHNAKWMAIYNDFVVGYERVPDVNSILGDKLKAFAPHTTAIRFGIDKELEIIKQLFDCYTLTRNMLDFSEVKDVYKQVAQTELGYRGMDYSIQTVLKDTICSCVWHSAHSSTSVTQYYLWK